MNARGILRLALSGTTVTLLLLVGTAFARDDRGRSDTYLPDRVLAASRAGTLAPEAARGNAERWSAAALLSAADTALAPDDDEIPGAYVPDRVLVKFRPGTSASEVARAHAALGSAVVDEIPGIDVQIVDLPRGRGVARGLGQYRRNKNVEYVEPDCYVEMQTTTPNDPWYAYWQPHLGYIHAPEAWDTTRGRSDVTIAVLDTGLAYTHADVQGRYVLGWDFINGDNDPWDDNSHGTSVYGVVGAATNNGLGIASVTWYNPVVMVKVADYTGWATWSAIAAGIEYAADAGCRAANVSFAGPAYSQSVQDAVDYAWERGMLVVCAAGNYATSTPQYPAACMHALSVTAVDGYGAICSFSSFGAATDLSAPGVACVITSDGQYGTMVGTSIAAPYVTGVFGLVASANPSLTAQQMVDIVEETADDLGSPGWDQYYGWGRVNACEAVLAAQDTPAGDTGPPTVSITAPVAAALVSTCVPVTVSASDDVGVTQVDLYVDGSLLASDAVAPYIWSWDTTAVPGGTHLLSAVAYDAAGNAGQSAPVSVLVDNNAPSATIISPSDGAAVSAVATVEAAASDAVGIRQVDFYLDGAPKHSVAAAPYCWNWDTTTTSNGPHTLVSRAYDLAGNWSDSSPVGVVVQNATAPTAVTETFTGRVGTQSGSATVWIKTAAAGAMTAVLSASGRGSCTYSLYDGAGHLIAADSSGADPKSVTLSAAAGSYRFVIGSSSRKVNYTLSVTHF